MLVVFVVYHNMHHALGKCPVPPVSCQGYILHSFFVVVMGCQKKLLYVILTNFFALP